MSDLQCPATFLLLTPESLPALDARGLRIAGVFMDASLGAETLAGALHVAAAHGCKVERLDLGERATLTREVEQLADSYRGETVLLLAPSSAVCAALHRAVPLTHPVVVAVDSDGWNVLSG
jgi:hypothetical protein